MNEELDSMYDLTSYNSAPASKKETPKEERLRIKEEESVANSKENQAKLVKEATKRAEGALDTDLGDRISNYDKMVEYSEIHFMNSHEETPNSHKKGLGLISNTGRGKSTFFVKVLDQLFNPRNRVGSINKRFRSYNMEKLNSLYTAHPEDFVNHLALEFDNILLDDMGSELDDKHYSNIKNIITKVITKIEELNLNRKNKIILHYTTNLTPTEIEKRYGKRISSRLAQLCEVFFLGGDDLRYS